MNWTIKSESLAFLANIINIILQRLWLQTQINSNKMTSETAFGSNFIQKTFQIFTET